MRIPVLALFTLASSGGCVLFDHDCSGKDCIDAVLSEEDTATMEPSFWLSPDSIEVGETVIMTLEADQDVNFEEITELHFYGDVELLASQPRDEELLLTVQIPSDAVTGEVDLVIEMEDGTTIWVDAAFTLSVPEGSSTEEGSTGGSEGSEGSTGEDPENSEDCE